MFKSRAEIEAERMLEETKRTFPAKPIPEPDEYQNFIEWMMGAVSGYAADAEQIRAALKASDDELLRGLRPPVAEKPERPKRRLARRPTRRR